MKDDIKITDNQIIVEEFNSFFSNIATKIKSNIAKTSTDHFSSSLSNHCHNSIFLSSTNETEIIKVVKQLKSSTSSGFDDISQSVIKQVIHCITKPLVHIMNLSVSSGKFPKDKKIGKIFPIFEGDPHIFSNYRPITLPCFS